MDLNFQRNCRFLKIKSIPLWGLSKVRVDRGLSNWEKNIFYYVITENQFWLWVKTKIGWCAMCSLLNHTLMITYFSWHTRIIKNLRNKKCLKNMIQNGPSQKSPPILPPQNVGTLLHMNFLGMAENFRSYSILPWEQQYLIKSSRKKNVNGLYVPSLHI